MLGRVKESDCKEKTYALFYICLVCMYASSEKSMFWELTSRMGEPEISEMWSCGLISFTLSPLNNTLQRDHYIFKLIFLHLQPVS